MKKVCIFLISLLFLGNYAFSSQKDILNGLIEDCYSGEKVDINQVMQLCNSISKENVEDYILVHTVLSSAMPMVSMSQYKSMLHDFEKDMQQIINNTNDETLLHLYSNYLYSKFSWEESTTLIVELLQALYVKNVFYNKSKKAMLDMAIWYISASNSSTILWNSFIKQQEYLLNEENLTRVELYNAYISYSNFYMKTLDSKKAFEYLDKAIEIFPNGLMGAIIKNNYINGKIGY